MSPSCEQATQSNTGMHVAGSGLHQPTAQSRIFERLFDVHSEAEDLSALSFWSAFAFGFSLETESLGGFETGLTGLLRSCLSRTDSAVVTPYSKQHAFSTRLPTARMISVAGEPAKECVSKRIDTAWWVLLSCVCDMIVSPHGRS